MASKEDYLLWAYAEGATFKQQSDDYIKAVLIIAFDSEIQGDTELQQAFAVGANGLPFSEVRKGKYEPK
jgi:hypothetical protein